MNTENSDELNEIDENENLKNSVTDKSSQTSIAQKISRFFVKAMVTAGMCGVKGIATLSLIAVKGVGILGSLIADLFVGILHIIRYLISQIIAPFRKRMKFTEELQQSLNAARKKSGKDHIVELVRGISIYLFREDGMFYTAFNYVLPIVAVAFFVGVVKYGSGLEYGISVEYNGKEIGIISDESDFSEATREVQQRISYVNGEEEVEFSPQMSLKIVSDDEQYISAAQLANKMLSESNQELTEAYGIYIDGEFVGAVKDKTPVEDALTDILVNYKVEGNAQNISFQNDVEYQRGIYLSESVATEEDAVKMMTAQTTNITTYVVEKGDSAVVISQKYNMSLDDFYTLNPQAIDGCTVGSVVSVVENESFLPIKYTREMEIVDFIDYATVEVETSSLNVGSSEMLVKGEKGEKRNKVEVTYVDGIERSRVVLSSEVTKDPIIEQIGVGTYTAKPASADTQLFGTGQFSWPVDGGYISDPFLSDRNHKGLDIAAPAGTDIYAAGEGVVVSAGWNTGGYGYVVMIDHLDGYETVYGHCSGLYVTEGQTVTRGQLIAAVGTTGQSTGNHCHFEVRYMGICYDPASYLNTMEQTE